MYAVSGILFLALAVLGFTVMMLASRKPNPAAWTSYAIVQETSAVGIVSLAGFGTAFIVQSADLFIERTLTATQATMIVAILAVFVMVWVRLKVRKTLAEYARQSQEATPPSRPVSPPAQRKAA